MAISTGNIFGRLTELLGRDVPSSVSNWLDNLSSFSTITNINDVQSLSDVELYEIAQKLLEQADSNNEAYQTAEYEEIAQAIFELIAADNDIDIEENDIQTSEGKAYSQDVKDFVDTRQAIQTDLADSGEIRSNTLTNYLDNIDPAALPSLFSALGDTQQAAVLAYYYEQGSDKATEIAKSIAQDIPQSSLDDVIEEMYENGDSEDVTKLLKDRLENSPNPAADVEALLSPDGRFEHMDSEDRANLVADLFEIAKEQNNDSLAQALIYGLSQQSDFVSDVKGADANSQLGKIENLPHDFDANNFQNINIGDLRTELGRALNDRQSDGDQAAEKLIDDIISQRSLGTDFIINPEQYNALSEKDKIDFEVTLFENLHKLTKEEITVINTSMGGASYSADRSTTKNALDSLKTALDALGSDAVFDPASHNFNTLFAALHDPRFADDKENILQGISDKALSSPTDLQAFHKAIGNNPEILDNFEEMLDNNPDNTLLNFLTSSYNDNSNYEAIFETITADSQDGKLFLQILTDGFNGDIDTSYEKPVDLNEAQETLFNQWREGDDDINEFNNFIANVLSGDLKERFSALTDFNSPIYQALDEDEHFEFFDDTINWVATLSADKQKDFFASIEPFSDLHLALIQQADDILVDNPDSELGQALQNITDDIAAGNALSNNDLKDIFPSDDDDDSLINYTYEIFNILADNKEANVASKEMQDFINILGDEEFTKEDAKEFLSNLSPFESERFFQSLLSDNSALFATDKDISKIVDTLFDTLSDNTEENATLQIQRRQFLEAIPDEGLLYEYLTEANFSSDLIEAIEDKDFSDFSDEEINAFFSDDLNSVLNEWVSDGEIRLYLDQFENIDLTSETGQESLDDILDNAKDNGQIQSLLSSLLADNDQAPDTETIIAVTKWLDDNDTIGTEFFNNLSSKSPLSKALQSLIDNNIVPFDDIDYKVDRDTGKINFGDDYADLLDLLMDNTNGASLLLSDEIEAQQEIISEIENSEGADNTMFRRLTNAALEGGDIDFDAFFAPDIDSDGDKDFSDAEDIIDLLISDNNYLMSSLNEEQLKNFMAKFVTYMKSAPDDLMEYFVEEAADNKGSIFTQALIAAGVDAEELDDANKASEFRAVLGDIDDIDAFVSTYKIAQKHQSSEGDVLDVVSNSLRGLTKKNDIREAVDELLDFAFFDKDSLRTLLNDVLNNGDMIKNLTPDQAEILMAGLFNRIKNEKSESGEKFSDEMNLFLNILKKSEFYDQHVKGVDRYNDIAEYFEDGDTKGLKSELNNLLRNGRIIEDYTENNTGFNELPRANKSVVGNDSASEIYQDTTIIDGYNALYKLLGFDELRGEAGQLTESFLNKSGQSGADIGKLAADQQLKTDEIAGIISILPPDEAADFIEEYLSNGGGNEDNDEIGFLLGQLMVFQIDGDIEDDEFETIINNINAAENSAVEAYFSPHYSVTHLINEPQVREAVMLSWGDTAQNITNFKDEEIAETRGHVAAWVVPDIPQQQASPYSSLLSPEYLSLHQGFMEQALGGLFDPSLYSAFSPIAPYPGVQDYYSQGISSGFYNSFSASPLSGIGSILSSGFGSSGFGW